MVFINIIIVKVLNGKVDLIDSQIKSIEVEKIVIDEEIVFNNRRIVDEIKSQLRKEFDSFFLEGKGEMFRELFSKVVYYFVFLNSGFIVIIYKNDLEIIIVYYNRNKLFLWVFFIIFRFNKVKWIVIVLILLE